MINGKIKSMIARELAAEFGCSLSAIRADVIFFNNQHLKETYHVSRAKRQKIITRDNSICYLCGKQLSNNEIVIEHKKPAAQGGTATDDNLAVACQSCNMLKRSKDKTVIFER